MQSFSSLRVQARSPPNTYFRTSLSSEPGARVLSHRTPRHHQTPHRPHPLDFSVASQCSLSFVSAPGPLGSHRTPTMPASPQTGAPLIPLTAPAAPSISPLDKTFLTPIQPPLSSSFHLHSLRDDAL